MINISVHPASVKESLESIELSVENLVGFTSSEYEHGNVSHLWRGKMLVSKPLLCDTLELLVVTLDSSWMMDWHVTGVILSCTASHLPSADTRRRQDDHPQCYLIVAGLRQYTTARHVCHQPQQAASGTEHTGQGDVSSTAFYQCQRVTQTTTLVASPPTNNVQDAQSLHIRH